MKRELAAAALLLALLGASVANLLYYDALTDRIETDLEFSAAAVRVNDFTTARKAYNQAEQRWLEAKGFTHVFIRHPELDDTSDAFFDLRQLLDEENREACAAAFEKLLYHLNNIDGMEHPSLGSVF